MAFDPKPHLIKVKGGQLYLPVKDRLLWNVEDCKERGVEFEIKTELVHLDLDGRLAIHRAEVYIPGVGRATGYGSETEKDFPSGWIEKSETKAIGRALACLGLGTQFALELDEGERVADSPVQERAAPPARPPQGRTGAPGGGDDASFAARAGAALRPSDGPLDGNADAIPEGLRAEVIALLERDGAALDLLKAKGTLPADMSAEQLRKTKDWLLERERRNVPVSVRLGRSIDAADTPEALRTAQQAVQQARDQKGISQTEYVGLLQAFERRRTELSGPLTAQAGMHPGATTAGAPS